MTSKGNVKIKKVSLEELIELKKEYKHRIVWTEEMDKKLYDFYGLVPTIKLAEHLNTTVNSIYKRIAELGLSVKSQQERRDKDAI